MQNKTTNRYTFKTIVAPEAVRAEFTALRDQLNSSDKELMQAFWNIAVDRLDDIKREVEMLQASSAQARAEKKEIKAAAKLKKAPKAKKEKKVTKVAAKKAPKKKAVKADKVTKVVDGDDDIETVVVDCSR